VDAVRDKFGGEAINLGAADVRRRPGHAPPSKFESDPN
jgi:hypothetical protein